MIKKYLNVSLLLILLSLSVFSQEKEIVPGAFFTGEYFPLLKGKRLAVLANQSSLINNVHLVDSLLHSGFQVVKIFSPEHGFRGTADAGEQVGNYRDEKTGLQVISLYGQNQKPTRMEMKGIDLVIFDIQDVGVRFYTYISTMHYMMEACAENSVKMMVLDRPDPNGFYIDGPVLDTTLRSFVGMHPVPVVYGMTIGEYALMINGEHWLKNGVQCELKVIPCKNYSHSSLYKLPVKPSPNLTNMNAVYLYPSVGLMEGTEMSVARGTIFPFEAIGCPQFPDRSFSFTPRSIPGISKLPKYMKIKCYGIDLRQADSIILKNKCINLQWLIISYNKSEDKDNFFNLFFDKLAGNSVLKEQVNSGLSAEEIRLSWAAGLEQFRKIRKKYLLYE
ncbi:MAG: DUF1343 domain-containing protein [Bacteroidia bacterium]|nr:DUF1343 domain-containing protein [Bacteroidia bacterium]